MIRFSFFLVFFAISSIGWAQFGNEWIKFNQTYYKIGVAKDGIYRLTYTNLQNAGFPVNSVNPLRFQIFSRGSEMPIYVSGETDAVFNGSDYIEFYGRKNDGTLDKDLYVQPNLQPSPYYNLYNDTAYYFLTFNPVGGLGKRMASFSEVNISTPKETYHIDEKLLVLTDNYCVGSTSDSYIQISAFDEGEGWTSNEIRASVPTDFVFSDIVNGFQPGGLPQLEMVLVGRNSVDHQALIFVGPSLRSLPTQTFSGYGTLKVTLPLAWTDIGADGKMTVRLQSPDRVSVSYIKLRYPQATNAAGSTEKFIELRQNTTGNKSYIEIANAPASSLLYDITNPLDVIRIGTSSTTTLNAMVQSTSSVRKLLLSSSASTPSVRKVSFRQINPAQHDYIIISHRMLMKPALGYSNVVEDYAAYRASPAGGLYDTLVMDINQLYNQFNYGEASPRAIRQFMKFMINTRMPKYLFLIGKSLDVTYRYYRAPTSSAFASFKDLVPTAGVPGSDIRFTAGLAGTTYEPAVPTGRLSVMTPIQVGSYLNKVKEMEALPYDDLWRKNILHLSGGANSNDLLFFRLFMEGFQQTAESKFLGGKVKALAKQSTDIELINISDRINKGLNLVTFFGHSAPQATDIDIGFVTNPAFGYNNPGKYPVLLINGCNSGSFFSPFTVFGEDWINAANKGAIGFIAHSSYGIASTLRLYSDLFYTIGYGDSIFIEKGLGDIQKEVAKQFMDQASESLTNIAQVQQMVLVGDPSVRLFGARKPDYEVNDNNLFIESFDGGPVTALSDSFALNVIVRNFGKAKEDTLRVRVTRTFNDNSTLSYDSIFKQPVLYEDTLVFVIKKERASGFGNNTFTVTIDADGEVSELSEANNKASVDLFIPLSGTKNLYPYDFAIVNKQAVDLTFQSTDLLSDTRGFIVEVDSIDSFTSGFKKTFTVNGKVLAKQAINLLSKDSLTYYWRTKYAVPLPGESTDWAINSFTYINNGPEGWAQIHFPQYLKNQSEGLVRDPVARLLKFEETQTNVFIRNYGAANTATNLNVSVKINNAEFQVAIQNQPCRENTINLIAFDKVTAVPYAPFLIFGQITCGREPQVIVSYTTTEVEAGGNDIIGYINSIDMGDRVVLFSIRDAGYASWSAAVKTKLGELGVSTVQIAALLPGEAVVIVGKKGDAPGAALIYKTTATPVNQQEMITNLLITGRYTSGSMKSTLIGPAAHWENLVTKTKSVEPADEAYVTVSGINLKGEETIILENVSGNVNLSAISASTYPFLKLTYTAKDEINLTASQLRSWVVVYTPVAEGFLFADPAPGPVKLEEGETWVTTYGFVNFSGKAFPDSLQVDAEIFNKNSRTSERKSFKIKPPLPGDTTLFSFTVNTLGKVGFNDVDVVVNPHIFPEQYYENNVIERIDYLEVGADEFKPVLDVTIDGRHVLNGDYVSAEPDVIIKVWDENKLVIRKDTLGVNVFLKYPCATCELQRINFSNQEISWSAATDDTDFTISFSPQNLGKGIYMLQVEARDASGNETATAPYEITFEVVDDPLVTLLSPYPNPAIGLITFTMVITGKEAPGELALELTNLNGKTVKQITWTDIFHVGTNNIDWDIDNSGLPAGLYIYSLTIRDKDGKEMSIKTPLGSNYFNANHGKIIIVK